MNEKLFVEKKRLTMSAFRRGYLLVLGLVLAGFAISTTAQEPPGTNGPAGWWPLQETVGTVLADASGNGNSGLLSGDLVSIPGQSGNGIFLDGNQSTIRVDDLGDSWDLDFNQALTLSLWVNPNELSGNQMLISKDNIYELELGHAGDDRYSLRLDNQRRGFGATTVQLDVWQHLAVTWDGQNVQYYFNGLPDGSAPFSGTLPVNHQDVGFGARMPSFPGDSASSLFHGGLDEIRVYSRALSDSEMWELFVASSSDFLPPLRLDTAPSGALPSGTTQATLSLRTDEAAACRFADTAGTTFSDMPSTFETFDGLHHSAIVHGLTDMQIATFFVRCRDELGNTHFDDMRISFAVGDPAEPIAHWSFEPGASDVALDVTGNGHDGAILGATPVPDGRQGYGLRFDGVDDHVRIADFFYGDELTLSFWLKTDDLSGSAYQYMLSHAGFNVPQSLNVYLPELASPVPGRIRTAFRDVDDATLPQDVTGNFADGEWHHYVLTVDDDGLKIYLDGVLRRVNDYGGDGFDPASDLFLGGRSDLHPDRFFAGTLDEVRIFAQALDAEQIDVLAALDSAPIGGDATLSADFAADVRAGVSPLTVQFQDASTATSTTITSWQWDFDQDGSIDSLQPNPRYTYTDFGSFTVSLTVSDGLISDTVTRTNWVQVGGISDGTVEGHQKIGLLQGGFTGLLEEADRFGSAAAALGDVDGDGITDVAVGAPNDNDGGHGYGAIWILFLNADGTVKGHQKISAIEGNLTPVAGQVLGLNTRFGSVIGAPGDIDGDGAVDLAVGFPHGIGATWILLLHPDGTVKGFQRISVNVGNFQGRLDNDDRFGSAVAGLGDLNGDETPDLAVTARGDDDGGRNFGAVWILFLNADGTVSSHQKISVFEGGFAGPITSDDLFGNSVAALQDLDGDGVSELAVGALGDSDGGVSPGAVWVLFLNADGTIKRQQKISSLEGGFNGVHLDDDDFAHAVAGVGDVDGDGVPDLAVGARSDSDGDTRPNAQLGAVWILFLNDDGTVKGHQKISATQGNFSGPLGRSSTFGTSLAPLGDVNQDGIEDLFVGAFRDDPGQTGSAWVLFLNGPLTEPELRPDFTAAPVRGLAPLTVDFENTSTAFRTTISATEWDFDSDGTVDSESSEARHTYAEPGSYEATLSISDGVSTRAESRRITALQPSSGAPQAVRKILGNRIERQDFFGNDVAELGDLDGDGLSELVVGSLCDDDGGDCTGAIRILFLNPDGTIRSEQKISEDFGRLRTDLTNNNYFGSALAPLGDLNGDGIPDLAVGAQGDQEDWHIRGAIWILFLNADGTVLDRREINGFKGNLSELPPTNDPFGRALASLGDLDGDGVTDLVVGGERGLWFLFLNANGTVRNDFRLTSDDPVWDDRVDRTDHLGSDVTVLGDLDGDGVVDLAVGAPSDGDDARLQGAVWIVFLNGDGSVKDLQKISETEGGFTGDLQEESRFGRSVSGIGDLDGDGVVDLLVAEQHALWVVFLQPDGRVKEQLRLDAAVPPLPADFADLSDICPLGDLNGDGFADWAVGSQRNDTVDLDAGAVFILFGEPRSTSLVQP